MELILYSTEGCHLCELAEALIRQAEAGGQPLRWSVVDIADDDALFSRYGWHIPVLKAGDAELRWPFDAEGLAEFLSEQT
ncbi:MAG: glutaredoxin family protein [Congregibacter sp.]